MHNWVGYVRTGAGPGPRKQVIVGITDYDYFGRSSAQKKASCRRRGQCHSFAKGDITALCHVVDIFKKVVLGTLWRDDLVPNWARWRWPRLEPGTIVPNITAQEAQTGFGVAGHRRRGSSHRPSRQRLAPEFGAGAS